MYWQIKRHEEKYAIGVDADKSCLLIPGWGMGSDVFEWLLPGLAQHFRVSCADVVSYPELSEKEAFLAELACAIAEPVWLIGWSLGGNIALDLALRYPAKVAGLCLLATTPKFIADEGWPVGMSADLYEKFAQGLLVDGLPANADKVVRRFDLLQAHGDERESQLRHALGEYRRQHQPYSAAELRRGLQLLASYDQRQSLPEIHQPMLWCYGEVDGIVNVYTAEEVRRLAPGAGIELFRLAAHLPFLTRPGQFFRCLGQLLDKKSVQIEKQKIARSFSRAATGYDHSARLQKWIAGELMQGVDRVDGLALDAGCGTGYWTARLAGKADAVIGLDMAQGMLHFAKSHCHPVCAWVEGDLESLPLADCTISTIFSSLAVQWCHDFSRVLDEWYRVLKPGGKVHVATLGADTLFELRDSWSKVDDRRHINRFMSCKDIEELVELSPFELAMLKVEKKVMPFAGLTDLLHDLKRIGAQTVIAGGETGLMGKNRFARLQEAYEQYRDCSGMLPATYEVIFLCLEKHR